MARLNYRGIVDDIYGVETQMIFFFLGYCKSVTTIAELKRCATAIGVRPRLCQYY